VNFLKKGVGEGIKRLGSRKRYKRKEESAGTIAKGETEEKRCVKTEGLIIA